MALHDLMQGIDVAAPIPDMAVEGVSHDSRSIERGYAFLALPGMQLQGTQFIPEAISRGAAAIIGPQTMEGGDPRAGSVPYLQVSDPAVAYSRMAANFYDHPSRDMTIVGITGTNGKTTTAMLVASMLNAAGIKSATLGTLGARWNNNIESTGYTTPDPATLQRLLAQMRADGRKGVVLEVSSHALAQHRTDDVAVDVAVFTNLTQDHLDYHGDMDHYLAAKQRLFSMLPEGGIAVINADDPAGASMASAAPGAVLRYGLGDNADLQVSDLGLSIDRTVANLSFGDSRFSVESALIGSYNLANILAATLAGLALKLPTGAIVGGIADVRAVPGRLERIESAASGAVMIDYAHTPDAYENVLGTLRQLLPRKTEITVLFGCGGDRDRSKRGLMAAVAQSYADHILITSDNPRTEPLAQINGDIVAGFSGSKHQVIEDRKEALLAALGASKPESLLLILGKGREAYEDIGGEKRPHDDVAIIENFEA